MKKLSFQWRITLMTSLLIAAACVALNLLLFHSGVYYFDSLGEYVAEYDDPVALPASGEVDIVFLELTQEQFEQFQQQFIRELNDAKTELREKGWLITAVVTVLSGLIAYYVSGRSLKPLRTFSEQTGKIQAETLTSIRLNEDTIPEFQTLSRSINRMLERLSAGFEAQRQFAGNDAHELRTPLTLMQARLELYERENTSLSSGTREALGLLKEQTERLSHMVKTLLEMSELETVSRKDRIELAPMIEEVLTDLVPLAEKSGVTLCQEGENVILTGSDVLLYRMLFNLVENGIRYNHPGGRVTVSACRRGRAAEIRVQDTGQGISPKDRENIFQPFFRVDKSRSRAMGGVGLGLALVWEIVRLHAGRIDVEDGAPEGTLIVVTLPDGGQSNPVKQEESIETNLCGR